MNLAAIDTNLVIALHALLKERNVTRAAKRLGLGQSATSHALARLRRLFGDALLVKAGRELVLTDRAEALLGPCTNAVAELERLFTEPSPFEPRSARRKFRIASTDNLEAYVLPRLTAILAKEAPGVELHFFQLTTDWISGLKQDEFDLKLGRSYPIPSGLRSEELFRDRLVCVARRGHPMGRRISLRQYAALSHIVVAPGRPERSFMDEALAAAGLERRVALVVPHFLPALFAVAASDYVVTVPSRLMGVSPLRLRSVPLPVRAAEYALTQVWSDRHDADPGHRWLRQTIRRSLAA
ncbi:MAG TPA: LysR family transcriptional regulator [Polyangiaceae bacterium]|nr:LysR family transcriptional regulator [Polyangiaceae bacterium]